MFGLGGGRRSEERIEPRLGDSGRRRAKDDDLRADPEDRPVAKSKRSKAKAAPTSLRSKGRRRGGRSLIGRMTYWCFVLGVWGAVGLTGLLIYYASQLPPIDQLAVPKRPPNIAILAEDGALIANRGDTGGAAVHLSDLPPYLPKAFVAIEEDRKSVV